jgi:transposase
MSTKKPTPAPKKAGPSKGPGQRYTAEFRREAMRMLEAGKSVASVSKELGVSVGTLNQWRLKALAGGSERGGAERGESILSENERLRKDVKALRMDLDIAKKAAAFFVRHGA